MFHIVDSLSNKMKGLYTGKLVYTHSQSKTQTEYMTTKWVNVMLYSAQVSYYDSSHKINSINQPLHRF